MYEQCVYEFQKFRTEILRNSLKFLKFVKFFEIVISLQSLIEVGIESCSYDSGLAGLDIQTAR